MTRQIFLDTETTGLSAADGDRIVEVGCIELDNRRLSGRTLHHYVNPQRSSHPDAVRVHGITDEFLADKPPFSAIADELVEFVRGAEVIIHNAAFDVAFLDAEFTRLGKPKFSKLAAQVTDSLLMAREMFPGKANSLDALCKRLEVDNSQRELHGALLDAGLLAEVYLRMTRGQGSLVIDEGGGSSGPVRGDERVDLRALVLPVHRASEEERAAHQAMLADLDKACGGKTLWRQHGTAQA
ncbi:DNA polymerase III subunit epsilon [beta proteobacterium AAP121]|nr:DNA polymerase III subunit epsilon [beta proteobacterium AAP65]KPF95096.1 DNA polymerase III subunit epsilon [beta proteobacterium AAP121]